MSQPTYLDRNVVRRAGTGFRGNDQDPLLPSTDRSSAGKMGFYDMKGRAQ